MGRVDEIMLQLEGQKSPFIHLLEGVAGGFQNAQNNSGDRMKNLILMEDRRAQAAEQQMKLADQQAKMQREAAMQERVKQIRFAQEKENNDAKRNATGPGTPVQPVTKYKEKITEGPEGTTITTEAIDEPTATVPNSPDEILADQFNKGKITLAQMMEHKKRGTHNPTGSSAKMLPANMVLALNEGKSVSRLLPEVEKAIKASEGKFGPTSVIPANNPWNEEAQTLDAQIRAASQAFGRFMEQGVLRKEDEEKYRKMFPNLRDTDPVKRNKLAIVRRMLASKYEDDRKTLGGSGYDVSAFGVLEIPDSVFDVPAPGAGESPEPGTSDETWSDAEEAKYQALLAKKGKP